MCTCTCTCISLCAHTSKGLSLFVDRTLKPLTTKEFSEDVVVDTTDFLVDFEKLRANPVSTGVTSKSYPFSLDVINMFLFMALALVARLCAEGWNS